MNIDHDAPTPEERELAERLARLGPHREPSPALDARILAAAHAASRASVRPRRRPSRWPALLGIAASVAFAFGLAWKLRPQPEAVPLPQEDRLTEEPLADYTPPPPAQVYAPRPRRVLEVPAPPPAEQPARTHGPGVARPRVARKAPLDEPPFAFEAAPAPPPPAPAMQAPAAGVVAPAAPAAAAAAPAGSAARAADMAAARREAADANAARALQEDRAQETRKAAAAAVSIEPEAVEPEVAEPDEEVVPPATADSPQVREAWLQRIRELAKSGRLDEARASLHEFRHRYPGVVLPDDLRALGE